MASEKRDRLAIKLFQVIEGEAEGRFAITVLLMIVIGTFAAWQWLK